MQCVHGSDFMCVYWNKLEVSQRIHARIHTGLSMRANVTQLCRICHRCRFQFHSVNFPIVRQRSAQYDPKFHTFLFFVLQ